MTELTHSRAATPPALPAALPAPTEFTYLFPHAGIVASRVQIDDIRLLKQSVGQNLRDGESPPKLGFDVDAQYIVDHKKSRIAVLIAYQVRPRVETAELADPCLWIAATYRITYAVNSLADLTDAQFKAFAYMNGVYNSWPYWRELVHSTISRMGLPTLILPDFTPANLAKLCEQKKEAEQKQEAAIL